MKPKILITLAESRYAVLTEPLKKAGVPTPKRPA
jgi:hypothetical protein